MTKKVLSILLVAALMIAMVTVGSIAVSATEKLEGSTIKFEVPDSWGEIKKTTPIYVHIFSAQAGESCEPWQARGSKMVREGETRTYSYEIKKSPKAEGVDWDVAIFSTTGKQTFDLTLSTKCIGDTAYVTGEEVENPVDSSKTAAVAAWKNNKTLGAHVTITSIGNIVGTTFLPYETPASLIEAWAANEKYAALATPEKVAQLTTDLQVIYDAQPTEPTTTEPATEPETTEPATEPATTEPATTEPATEPATTEPVTEPATTEPATEPVTKESVRIDEYGRIGGIPTPWKYGMPAKQAPTEAQPEWDGYYKIYYFEAPAEWLENDNYKEKGFEIGFYWYCGAEAVGDWPGTAADAVAPLMYQQFIDENPSATEEDLAAAKKDINEKYGNIFCGIAPSYVPFIIWNNGVDKGLPTDENYDPEKAKKAFQTVDINVEDFTVYEEGGLQAADFCGGITYLNGKMRDVLNPVTGEKQHIPEVSWRYFNPLTGEQTTEALKDKDGKYVVEYDAYGDEVHLNPYFDMDYSYKRPDSASVNPPQPVTTPEEETTTKSGDDKGVVETSQDTTMFVVVFVGLLMAAGAVVAVRRKRTHAE